MNKILQFSIVCMAYILIFSFTRCNGNLKSDISYDDDEKYGLVKVEKISDTDSILSLFYDGDIDEPKEIISMRNGERHGLTKEYYKNGTLKHEINFLEGKIDGFRKDYDSIDGYLKSVTYYEDDRYYNEVRYSKNGKITHVFTWNYYPKPDERQMTSLLVFDEYGIIESSSYYALINSTDTVQLGEEYICNVKLPFKNTTKEEIQLELECYDKWDRILDKKKLVGKDFSADYKYKPSKSGSYKIRGFVLYPFTLPKEGLLHAKIYLEKDFYVK
jgi:hypothetical protein